MMNGSRGAMSLSVFLSMKM